MAWEKKRLFFSFFTPERKTKIVSYQQLITPFSFVSVLPPLHNATKPVLFFFMMILVFGASISLLWERNQKSVTKLQTQDMASESSEISVANFLNFFFQRSPNLEMQSSGKNRQMNNFMYCFF